MATQLRVEVLGEAGYDAWARFVAASPDGSVYSLPRYLEVLCRAAGGRFRVLAALQGEEIVGGVALYERDSRFGPYLSPRRLLHYNGVVMRRYATKYPSEQTARDLKTMGALAEALSQRGYAWATLNCTSTVGDVRPFLAAGWTATPNYTYVVSLQDSELVWSRIEQNLRRLVKRCQNDGVVVGVDEDFDAFYSLHAETMGRIEQQTYLGRKAFGQYFEALRTAGLCRLFQARLPGGALLAGQLVLLGPCPISHTVAAAADPSSLQMGATAFLRFKVFQALAEAGFAGNDLTDASLNPVTHFKSQLGGELRLCLALSGPRSWGYRLGHGAAAISRRALVRLARPLRRAMGRR